MAKTKGGPYLDYVWISKFRGIENQGFQFSRKYTYSYDAQKNILTRFETDISKKYIEGFFDDNIELNAIVGKNGCGKTSLMQAIYMYLANGSFGSRDSAIFVFRDGKVYSFCNRNYLDSKMQDEIIYQEFINGCTEIKVKWNTNLHQIPNLRCIYHSNAMDYQAIDFSSFNNNDYTNASMSSLLTTYLENSFFSISDGYSGYVGKAKKLLKGFYFDEFEKQISLFTRMSEYIYSHNIMSVPQYATVSIKSIGTLINDLQWKFRLKKEELNTLFKPLKNKKSNKGSLLEKFKKKLSFCLIAWLLYSTCYDIETDDVHTTNNKQNNASLSITQRCNLTLQIMIRISKEIYSLNNNAKFKINNSWDLVLYFLESLNENVEDNYNILGKLRNQIMTTHRYDLHLWFYKTYPVKGKYPTYEADIPKWYQAHEAKLGAKLDIETGRILKLISKNAIFLLDFACELAEIEDESDDTLVTNPEFIINLIHNRSNNSLNIDLRQLWNNYRPLCLIYDFMNISWNLSSGEYARWAFLARIYNFAEQFEMVNKFEFKTLILLLDEADMLLHPEWQRNYVEQVLSFVKLVFPNIYVQIIIATHSPIMLSDIPNQNILFLKRNNENRIDCCFEVNETFSANIFSLYQDSFFIEDTGIGSYAKRKLEEIVCEIHRLPDKSKYSNEELMLLIGMVGDVYLRAKLKNEYYLYRSEESIDSGKRITRVLRSELRKKDDELKKKENELERMKKQLEMLIMKNNYNGSEAVFDDKD